MILHDGVDIKNFENSRHSNEIKNVCYVGSFYKGRGIDLILYLAKKFPYLQFNLYGQSDTYIKSNLKNVKIHEHVDYCYVPDILKNSDLLLMPYSNKVSVRSKTLSADYFHHKMLIICSWKIIIHLNLMEFARFCHIKNAIIVKDYDYVL